MSTATDYERTMALISHTFDVVTSQNDKILAEINSMQQRMAAIEERLNGDTKEVDDIPRDEPFIVRNNRPHRLVKKKSAAKPRRVDAFDFD